MILRPSLVIALGILISHRPLSAADATRPATSPALHIEHAGLVKLTWQLAAPTNTFSDRSVFEAIDALHHLTVHHLQLSPGQPLSVEHSTVTINSTMDGADVDALLAKLKSAKMDIVSFGPVDLGTTDESARAVFAFAKRIKAKDVIASASLDSLERLDRLATEAGVNLALPIATESNKPVSPDVLAKALDARSKRIGVYADLQAWKQSGTDPLAAVTALKGHIVHVGIGAADPSANLPAILQQLRADGFKGIVTVASPPGPQAQAEDQFVEAVNAMSDAIAAVAGK